MARALISESRELFCSLDVNELYGGKYSANDFAAGKIPTLFPIIRQREKLTYAIAKNIMGSSDVHQAAFAIDYWINVAYECAFNSHLKDINSAAIIYTSLQISSVYNLLNGIKENSLINKETLVKYEKLSAILSHENNYAARREHLSKNPDVIPAIDYQLTDITMTRESNNQSIETIHAIIEQLKYHQRTVADKPFNNPIEPVNVTSKMPEIEGETETKLKDELYNRYIGYKKSLQIADNDPNAAALKQSLNTTREQLAKVAIKGKAPLIQDGGLARIQSKLIARQLSISKLRQMIHSLPKYWLSLICLAKKNIQRST